MHKILNGRKIEFATLNDNDRIETREATGKHQNVSAPKFASGDKLIVHREFTAEPIA